MKQTELHTNKRAARSSTLSTRCAPPLMEKCRAHSCSDRFLKAGLIALLALLLCGAAIGSAGAEEPAGITTAAELQTALGGPDYADLSDSTVTLKKPVTLSAELVIKDSMTLNLGGYVITAATNQRAFTVDDEEASFTVTDNTSTAHKFVMHTGSRWVLNDSATTEDYTLAEILANPSLIAEGKVVSIPGGCITGGNGDDGSGGVDINGGTFTMSGGNIVGNTATYGGGVYINVGTFTMSGGNIVGNTAMYGGGVCSIGTPYSFSTFKMSDSASIVGNSATNGGGVCGVGDSSFEMSGGSITGNTATGYGGGVDFSAGTFNAGTFKVSGTPVIKDNIVSVKDNIVSRKTNNVDDEGEGNSITLAGPLTNGAEIHITQLGKGNNKGNKFGTAEAGTSGAEHFINDNNASLVGSISGGELIWAEKPEPTTYTLTFLDYDGSVIIQSSVAAGAAITAPTPPTRTGYTFVSWDETVPATMPASDQTFKATGWTLDKPTLSVTTEPATYGDNLTLTASTSAAGTIKYTFYDGTAQLGTGSSSSYTHTKPSAKDHSYTVKISDGTLEATSDAVTKTVAKKDVTITGLSVANKVYDGTPEATVSGTAAVSGVIDGDDVTVTPGTASFGNKNVGTNKDVTFTGYSLSGADAGNYTLTAQPATVKATITAKDVTITGLSVVDKVYDGTTTATVSGTAAVSGAIGSDNVTVTDGTASFADKNVGTDKTVNFTGYGLGGADAGNYNLSAQPTGTASITAKALTITANDKTITYGDAPANDGVTYTGFVGGESESVLGGTLDYDYSYTQYDDVGNTYTITPKGLTSTNYNITFVTGKLTVTQKSIAKITAVSSGKSVITKTYNGNTTLPIDVVLSSTDIVNSDAVTISYDAAVAKSHYDDKTAKTGKTVTISGFSLDGTKKENYTVADDLQITLTNGEITKKEISTYTASPDPIEKVYDGNTTLPSGVTISSTNIESDDTVTFTFNGAYADGNAGDSKTVSFTGIAIAGTGADNGNYTLSAAAFDTTTGKITAKPLSECTIDAIPDQTYTGSPITPDPVVKNGSLTLIKDVDYTVSYADNTGIGTATVTVTAAPNGNYSGTNSATFNIVAGSTKVTLNPNGGTAGTVTEVTATYGQPMPALTEAGKLPTREGYTFAGYYGDASAGIQYYKADGTSAKNWDKTADTTLYAHWTPKTYTITLSQGDVDEKGTETVTVTYDSSLITPAIQNPIKHGYSLDGWYMNEKEVINENGQFAPNATGYTDAQAHWIHDGDITLTAVLMPTKKEDVVPEPGKPAKIDAETIPDPETNFMLVKVVSADNVSIASFNADKIVGNPDTDASSYRLEKTYTVYQMTAIPVSGNVVPVTINVQLSEEDNPNNVILRHYTGDAESGRWDSTPIPPAKITELPESEAPYTHEFVFNVSKFSPFALTYEIPVKKSSPSQGTSVWATELPTATPTATPTPTPVPTPDMPTVKPTAYPTPTPASPAPFIGILAGLGAAAVLFCLRRK